MFPGGKKGCIGNEWVKSPFPSLDIYIFVLTFWYVEKPLDKKVEVNFKIYDIIGWTANS